MTLKQIALLSTAIALFTALVCVFYVIPMVHAAAISQRVSTDQPFSYNPGISIVATTTSATSTAAASLGSMSLKGAKKVTFLFQRGDTTGQGNSGSTRFEIEVTPDGNTWYDYNQLRLNHATSSVAATVTLSGTSTALVALDNIDTFAIYAARVIIVEATDGEHTAKGWAEF